ncbi:MAG: hypothetical protein IT162_12890 [Bryobacterales bacterium]|nr:hypothetical protein [Bryobacterales bacterium]
MVRTLQQISAHSAAAGERIEVELAEPVDVDGVPPVPESAKAVVSVVDVIRGRRDAGRALLRLRLTQLRPSPRNFVEVHTQPVELRGAFAHLRPGTTLAFELASPVTASPRNAARR